MNTFAFIIALVVILLTMIYAIVLVLSNEVNRPRNKVRFYITKDNLIFTSKYVLWIGKPNVSFYMGRYAQNVKCGVMEIARDEDIKYFGIDLKDYSDMECGEIREVFLNLEG